MKRFVLPIALCLLLNVGCGRRPRPSAPSELVNLNTHGLAWSSTKPPLIAGAEDGTLYVFWRGRPCTTNASGIVRIPSQYVDGGKEGMGLATVVGVSIYEKGRWVGPSVLNGTDVKGECDPRYAWCDKEIIHLIVRMATGREYHLLYDKATKEWRKVMLPGSSEYVSLPLGCCAQDGQFHVGMFSEDKLCYLWYDGQKWNEPLVICEDVKFSHMWGGYKPRVTATKNGRVHIVWNSQNLPRHVVIQGGKIVSSSDIQLEPPVAKGDDLDITSLSDGRVLIAYQPHEDSQADKNAVYVVEYDTKNGWGKPVALVTGAGLNLGSPQLVSFEDTVLLAWWHRTERTVGSAYMSGPIVSFIIRDGTGAWGKRKPVVDLSSSLHAPIPGAFYTLWCDRTGLVHMAWERNEDVYYIPLEQLGRKKTGKP